MGIKASNCLAVGTWPKNQKANSKVNKGAILESALALVTDIRCMPSIHIYLETPKIIIPLNAKNQKDFCTVAKGTLALSAKAKAKNTGMAKRLLKNTKVSLLINLRNFC